MNKYSKDYPPDCWLPQSFLSKGRYWGTADMFSCTSLLTCATGYTLWDCRTWGDESEIEMFVSRGRCPASSLITL